MDVSVKSGSSANTLTINSDNEALAKPTGTASKSGVLLAAARSGTINSITGTSGLSYTGSSQIIETDSNDDYAVRISVENCLFSENFLGSSLNNNLWSNAVANSATVTVSGGNVVLTPAVTAGTGAIISSYRPIPINGSTPTCCVFRAKINGCYAGQKVIEFGLGIPPAAGVTSAIDGVFFRFGEEGEIRCVINNAGWEIKSTRIDYPVVNAITYEYKIIVSQSSVRFMINDKIVWSHESPPGFDSPTRSANLNIFGRLYLVNPPPFQQTSTTLSIPLVQCWSVGGDINRPYAHERSSSGYNCNNGGTGFATLGTQSNIGNSSSVSSSTLSNIALPASGYSGSTLGGEFQFAALSASDTDLIVFAYQVPAGSASFQARNLVINGIRIWVAGIGAAGDASIPTLMVWSLGYGATNFRLDTANGAGTKAPVIIPLGTINFTPSSPIGFVPDPIDISFEAPVSVYPGQYLHVIVKIPIGTNTASRLFRGLVGFDGYWE